MKALDKRATVTTKSSVSSQVFGLQVQCCSKPQSFPLTSSMVIDLEFLYFMDNKMHIRHKALREFLAVCHSRSHQPF
jgi:hypothetical protein